MGKARLLTDKAFYNENPTRNQVVRYRAGRRHRNNEFVKLRYEVRPRMKIYHRIDNFLNMIIEWGKSLRIKADDVKQDSQKLIDKLKKSYDEKKK